MKCLLEIPINFIISAQDSIQNELIFRFPRPLCWFKIVLKTKANEALSVTSLLLADTNLIEKALEPGKECYQQRAVITMAE